MIVRQAAHVLDLLEYFAEHRRPATLLEISEHFGWPRSSAYNTISTLTARGFLYEPQGRGRFYPTGRWLVLAQKCVSGAPTPEILLDLIVDLAEQTGETITLAAPNGQYSIFLEVMMSPAAVRYSAEVGGRVPIHVTGSGQALLSLMTRAQRDAVLRKAVFERYGAGSPMSIAEVEQRLDDGLRRGWFESRSNYSVGLNGVSIPLAIEGRSFALTIAGPAFRLEPSMPSIAAGMHRTIARHLGRDFLAETLADLRSLA